MSDTGFLTAIYHTGRIRLSAAAEFPPPDSHLEDIRRIDHLTRQEFPQGVPALVFPVATWAAGLLHGAITCYAFRDLDAAHVGQILSAPCPATEAPPAQIAYSADLALQFLPDLVRLARGIAPEDPLVTGLLTIARAWPFSSVGITEIDSDPALDITAFIDDTCLRMVYVDRILARNATARLAHPKVAALAKAAIGLHESLAPDAAKILQLAEVL